MNIQGKKKGPIVIFFNFMTWLRHKFNNITIPFNTFNEKKANKQYNNPEQLEVIYE